MQAGTREKFVCIVRVTGGAGWDLIAKNYFFKLFAAIITFVFENGHGKHLLIRDSKIRRLRTDQSLVPEGMAQVRPRFQKDNDQ